MHPIATYFSPEARKAVREAFTNVDNVQTSVFGEVTMFDGTLCCPIGIAMIVDGRDSRDGVQVYYAPGSETVSKAFIGLMSRVVEEASASFINSRYTAASVQEQWADA